MAHLDTLSVRSLNRPARATWVDRALLRHVTAQSLAAQAELSTYDGLTERLSRTLARRRLPAHATVGWYLRARLAAWRTVDELRAHSDRELADIQIPRELIRAVATVSAFGWPRAEDRAAAQHARQQSLLARLRRSWFPTEAEQEEAYLADASDIRELEFRMAEWDRRHGRRAGAAGSF